MNARWEIEGIHRVVHTFIGGAEPIAVVQNLLRAALSGIEDMDVYSPVAAPLVNPNKLRPLALVLWDASTTSNQLSFRTCHGEFLNSVEIRPPQEQPRVIRRLSRMSGSGRLKQCTLTMSLLSTFTAPAAPDFTSASLQLRRQPASPKPPAASPPARHQTLPPHSPRSETPLAAASCRQSCCDSRLCSARRWEHCDQFPAVPP